MSEDNDRVKAAPSARKLAREYEVDLSLVTPSNGVRITAQDIINYVDERSQKQAEARLMKAKAESEAKAAEEEAKKLNEQAKAENEPAETFNKTANVNPASAQRENTALATETEAMTAERLSAAERIEAENKRMLELARRLEEENNRLATVLAQKKAAEEEAEALKKAEEEARIAAEAERERALAEEALRAQQAEEEKARIAAEKEAEAEQTEEKPDFLPQELVETTELTEQENTGKEAEQTEESEEDTFFEKKKALERERLGVSNITLNDFLIEENARNEEEKEENFVREALESMSLFSTDPKEEPMFPYLDNPVTEEDILNANKEPDEAESEEANAENNESEEALTPAKEAEASIAGDEADEAAISETEENIFAPVYSKITLAEGEIFDETKDMFAIDDELTANEEMIISFKEEADTAPDEGEAETEGEAIVQPEAELYTEAEEETLGKTAEAPETADDIGEAMLPAEEEAVLPEADAAFEEAEPASEAQEENSVLPEEEVPENPMTDRIDKIVTFTAIQLEDEAEDEAYLEDDYPTEEETPAGEAEETFTDIPNERESAQPLAYGELNYEMPLSKGIDEPVNTGNSIVYEDVEGIDIDSIFEQEQHNAGSAEDELDEIFSGFIYEDTPSQSVPGEAYLEDDDAGTVTGDDIDYIISSGKAKQETDESYVIPAYSDDRLTDDDFVPFGSIEQDDDYNSGYRAKADIANKSKIESFFNDIENEVSQKSEKPAPGQNAQRDEVLPVREAEYATSAGVRNETDASIQMSFSLSEEYIKNILSGISMPLNKGIIDICVKAAAKALDATANPLYANRMNIVRVTESGNIRYEMVIKPQNSPISEIAYFENVNSEECPFVIWDMTELAVDNARMMNVGVMNIFVMRTQNEIHVNMVCDQNLFDLTQCALFMNKFNKFVSNPTYMLL